jgi:hypothetical protein
MARPAPLPDDDDNIDVPAHLARAHVNPRTGLASDYLNHFSEAIMLLEMIRDIPECLDDFLLWTPKTYREHFLASQLSTQDIAIMAYDTADAVVRAEFDEITAAMTSILTTVAATLRATDHHPTRVRLAEQTAGWLKPLALLASGVINGGATADVDTILSRNS